MGVSDGHICIGPVAKMEINELEKLYGIGTSSSGTSSSEEDSGSDDDDEEECDATLDKDKDRGVGSSDVDYLVTLRSNDPEGMLQEDVTSSNHVDEVYDEPDLENDDIFDRDREVYSAMEPLSAGKVKRVKDGYLSSQNNSGDFCHEQWPEDWEKEQIYGSSGPVN